MIHLRMFLKISLFAVPCIIAFSSVGCEETLVDSISDDDTTSLEKEKIPVAVPKLSIIASTEVSDSGIDVLFLTGEFPQTIPVLQINKHDARVYTEKNYLYWKLSNVDIGEDILYSIKYEGSRLTGSFKIPNPVTELACNDVPCRKDSVTEIPATDSVTFSWSDSTATKYIYSYQYENPKGLVEVWDVFTKDSLVSIPVSDSLLSPITFTLARADSEPITGNRNPDLESDHVIIFHNIRGTGFSAMVQVTETSAEQSVAGKRNHTF